MTSVEPKVGETWYFLIGDAVCCTSGEVVNITPNTATIRSGARIFGEPSVYARSKITFVERVASVDSRYMCDND
jgi:hypothetical protein